MTIEPSQFSVRIRHIQFIIRKFQIYLITLIKRHCPCVADWKNKKLVDSTNHVIKVNCVRLIRSVYSQQSICVRMYILPNISQEREGIGAGKMPVDRFIPLPILVSVSSKVIASLALIEEPNSDLTAVKLTRLSKVDFKAEKRK